MKALKYISLFVLILTTSTSCMNDFDAPEFTNPPFGNNEIGEAKKEFILDEKIKNGHFVIIRFKKRCIIETDEKKRGKTKP